MKKRVIKGMSIMETGILIALVAVAGIGILTTFGGTVNETFQKSTIKVKNYEPFGFAKASSSGGSTAVPEDTIGNGGTDGLGTGTSNINTGQTAAGSANTSTNDETGGDDSTVATTIFGAGGKDGSGISTTNYSEPGTLTTTPTTPTTPEDKDLIGSGGSDGSGCSGKNCSNNIGR